jgi:H+/Cl- antiporter ClcA
MAGLNREFWRRPEVDLSPRKTVMHAALWTSAAAVGLLAALFASLISEVQGVYFRAFHAHPVFVSCVAPLLFVVATWLVERWAPAAKGSGIPQVLAVIDESRTEPTNEGTWVNPLVSLRTAFVKVLSASTGILGGASIGREGPTVQIAASAFAWIGRVSRRFAPQIDFQSFVVAGGAAGIAAAFNTPLAGITFALEEVADGMLGPFRQSIMVAVIIAGITTQALSGNYLYFGRPSDVNAPVLLLIPEGVLIGLCGGLLGGIMAKLLSTPQLSRLPTHWVRRAFIAGCICSAVGYFTLGDTSGSGYEVTRRALESNSIDSMPLLFPFWKLLTTTMSYLSGMAGGIFSPSLSIGAGVGLLVAHLAHFANYKACALLGMVAFFSGAIRAPLTGVVIVMEMSDEHLLIVPFMIAAYIAHAIGRRIMPTPLYHYLAERMEAKPSREAPPVPAAAA